MNGDSLDGGPLVEAGEAKQALTSALRAGREPRAMIPSIRLTETATRPAGLLGRIRATPPAYLLGFAAGMGAYLLAMGIAFGNRPEQFVAAAAMLLLCVWSDGTRRFFTAMLPFIAFGLIYDLTHITEPLVRYLHVHIVEPYLFDKTLFGIHDGGAVLTPNEFFARHHGPLADFLAGTAYIVYVYWAIGFAVYLALFRPEPEARRLLLRYGWTFLIMNVVGFATYYLYPAAPPWYVTQYGLGPTHYEAQATAAAAARWDELTGIHYFAGFYGRSADVFGAIPSLHVAYPLMVFIYGRHFRKVGLDVVSFAFFLLVCFAAVYLQHHYVLDVLLGVGYTLAAWGIDALVQRLRRRPEVALRAGGAG